MFKRLITVCLIVQFACNAFSMTVPQAINEVTEICPPTAYNCIRVSERMHDRLYAMQKSELKSIGVWNGRKGHRFILYKDFGDSHVVTTWTDNRKDWYIVDKDVGRKSLHQVCLSIMPDYSFIKVYNRGRGAMYHRIIPRSRIIQGYV